MPNFSSRIKLLRTERGITQEQLASMLKVSRRNEFTSVMVFWNCGQKTQTMNPSS